MVEVDVPEVVDLNNHIFLNDANDDEEEEDDEELDELEARQIPDEGPVQNAMKEVKHKLEISQQLFSIAGSMQQRRLIF